MERKSDNAITNRIYDEFEPLSNWKTEQGFETLTIYLPGFKKEQLKVQLTTTRKIRVIGERPAGANKWIRFRKEFPIPPNTDIDSVSAKFEGTDLVIKLTRTEPMVKQPFPTGSSSKSPPVSKENPKIPSPGVRETENVQPRKEKEAELAKQVEKVELPKSEKGAEQAKKEEAFEVEEKPKICDGILNQDYRCKVNAYKENLGGYVALMKNNKTALTAGMVAPAAAVLLLSIGFYAGRMFTSY